MTSPQSPLYVGVFGLGRNGVHHLERLSLQHDFKVAAVHDEAATQFDPLTRFGVPFVATWEAFVSDPAIDVVLVASDHDDRAGCVVNALSQGKHVAVQAPLAHSVADAESMLDAARHARRTLTVIHQRRWTDDFLTALSVARSGSLGAIHSARILVYGYGVASFAECPSDSAGPRARTRSFATSAKEELPISVKAAGLPDTHESDPCGYPAAVEPPSRSMAASAGHYVEQLLELLPGPVRSVFARFGTPGRSSADDRTVTLFVTYTGGATALIEINLASLAPLKTGWVLSGSEGAYENFRIYQITDDREVFGTPIEPVGDGGRDGLYESLRRDVESNTVVTESARRGHSVSVLLEAAVQSAVTGQVVFLESDAFVYPAAGGAGVEAP